MNHEKSPSIPGGFYPLFGASTCGAVSLRLLVRHLMSVSFIDSGLYPEPDYVPDKERQLRSFPFVMTFFLKFLIFLQKYLHIPKFCCNFAPEIEIYLISRHIEISRLRFIGLLQNVGSSMSNNTNKSADVHSVYGRDLSLLWAFPTALEQVRKRSYFFIYEIY